MTNDNHTMLVAVTKREISGNKTNTVDAKGLHKFLGVGKGFTAWIDNRIKQYKFKENQDFIIFSQMGEKSGRGRPSKEYYITLDMAKELSMVERTDKGREARQYFLECERVAMGQQPAVSALPTASPNASSAITTVLYEGVPVLLFKQGNETLVSLKTLCAVTELDYSWQSRKQSDYNYVTIEAGGESVLAMPWQQAINWLNDINPEKIQFKKRSKVVSARLELPTLIKQAVDNTGDDVTCIEQEPVKKKPQKKEKSTPFKTIVTIIHKSGEMDAEEYNEPVMVMSVGQYLEWRDKMTELENLASRMSAPAMKQVDWRGLGKVKALSAVS